MFWRGHSVQHFPLWTMFGEPWGDGCGDSDQIESFPRSSLPSVAIFIGPTSAASNAANTT